MTTFTSYAKLKKPSWAPPSWVFGPAWTFLYILIVYSFGSVFLKTYQNQIPAIFAIPFALNLVFNFAFSPIQFTLKNNFLASIDIILIWVTLVWSMIVIWPILPWITYINIPYLLWVSFAISVQLAITWLNRR